MVEPAVPVEACGCDGDGDGNRAPLLLGGPDAVLDPPYEREELYRRDLERLGAASLLKQGAIVVVEHLRSVEMPANIPGLVHLRTHPQGHSALTFYEPEGE